MPPIWKEHVRPGIVQFMAWPETMGGEGPIAETAAAILEEGFFEVIEVGPVNGSRERASLRERVAAAGGVVAFAAQPILLKGKLDLNSLEPAERRKAVDAVRTGLEQARELGAAGLAVLSGPDPGPERRARAMDALTESILAICGEAGGMSVHLEVFDFDVDKRCLVGPTAPAAAWARDVRGRAANFGLMLDLSHLPLQRESIREALAEARDVLTHVHVGNCVLRDPKHPQYGDQHPRFGLPGGENDAPQLAEFLSGLFEIGYLGAGERRIVSVEVKPVPGETSAELLAATRRTWEAAWSEVKIPS